MTRLLIVLGWTVLGALLGYGARQLSVWLARREGLEVGFKRWQVLGPPILNAVLYGLFAAQLGASPVLLIRSLWIVVLVQIIFFDLEHRLILDVVQVPAMVVALALSFVTPHVGFMVSLVSGLGAGLFFLLLALVGGLIFKAEAMGFGDVKLAALMGFILGISPQNGWGVARAVFLGIILGGVVSLLLIAIRVKSMKDTLAYGPYLAAGALVVLYQVSSQ